MPNRDRSGPLGQGARTGRGLGNCQPGDVVQPPPAAGANRPMAWGGRAWDAITGQIFGRGRGNRRRRW